MRRASLGVAFPGAGLKRMRSVGISPRRASTSATVVIAGVLAFEVAVAIGGNSVHLRPILSIMPCSGCVATNAIVCCSTGPLADTDRNHYNCSCPIAASYPIGTDFSLGKLNHDSAHPPLPVSFWTRNDGSGRSSGEMGDAAGLQESEVSLRRPFGRRAREPGLRRAGRSADVLCRDRGWRRV